MSTKVKPQASAESALKLLTVEQVASLLEVNEQAVYRMARRGELPTVRLGARRVRFRAGDVELYIDSRLNFKPYGSRS